MPKGVEHPERWIKFKGINTFLFLRCQKALSTGNVPLQAETQRQVLIPQMPKGVEHNAEISKVIQGQTVLIPQMPKGVEHMVLNIGPKASAGSYSSDAKRR